jgi:alpha-1,6-mannosyltransferase
VFKVHVHISNLAAQTGASLFLQEHSPPYHHLFPPPPSTRQSWIYNKTEGLSPQDLTASLDITHLLAESLDGLEKDWKVIETMHGFARWRLNLGAMKMKGLGGVWDVLGMEKEDKIWILERKGWSDRTPRIGYLDLSLAHALM